MTFRFHHTLFSQHDRAAGPRRHWARLAALLACFALILVLPLGPAARPAAADVGPKPQVTVHVTYEGRPVPDSAFQARMLACLPPGAAPYRDGPSLPGLDQLDLTDPAGCRWQAPSAPVWGGDCTDG